MRAGWWGSWGKMGGHDNDEIEKFLGRAIGPHTKKTTGDSR